MKILLIDPAADWSTRDVYNGLRDGLKTCGHEVIEFRYGKLSTVISRALDLQWKANGRTDSYPSPADTAYLVSQLAVTWAIRYQPDITLVVSGMYWHPDAYQLLRLAGLRSGVILTESPYDFPKEEVHARVADFVWTNERTAVAPFRLSNPRTFYLRHAYHPAVHRPDRPVAPETPAHGAVFVGTGFQERVDLLTAVDWTGLDLALYGMWRLVPSRSRLRACIQQGIIDNDLTSALYRKADVGINLFRSSMGFGRKAPRIFGAESLGPRAYELAACGAFFVSEYRAEVVETFGDAVPTFTTSEELQDLVRHWRDDVTGRRRIAEALPALMGGHSWVERAEQVVSDLRSSGGGA